MYQLLGNVRHHDECYTFMVPTIQCAYVEHVEGVVDLLSVHGPPLQEIHVHVGPVSNGKLVGFDNSTQHLPTKLLIGC